MADKVTFSGKNIDLQKYAAHHDDVEKSLLQYFGAAGRLGNARFVGYTNSEVDSELHDRLDEVGTAAAMTVLAAVEAAFRIDYLQRCYQKRKDPISRAFREVYKIKMVKASLEDDILAIWKENTPKAAFDLGALTGALKFRHWIAHGRYWAPKLGQQYDYVTVYGLATSVLQFLSRNA